MKEQLYGLREGELDILHDAFFRCPEIETVVLFGSRAMGNYKAGSDVDIALQGVSVNHKTVVAVSGYLNEETLMPYKFDVLDFNTIDNKELLKHIERVGKTIYKK